MEPSKVKLPREVADAIESLRINNSNENIVMYALNPKGNCGFTIAKSLKDGVIVFDTFLQALVNGYEVEESKEDKVRKVIQEYCNGRIVSNWVVDAIKEIYEGAVTHE